MRLTKQYAYGLFSSISDENPVDFYHELNRLAQMMNTLPEYVHLVEFKPEEFSTIREILTDEIDPLLINFLEVLARDRMLSRLETITEDYRLALIEENLLYNVRVFSASQLSSESKNNIEQLVERRWGNDYLLSYEIDENILGGIRLEVNGAIIDTTFRSRIDQIIREVQYGSKR